MSWLCSLCVSKVSPLPFALLKNIQADVVTFAAHHILNHIDFEMV